MIGIPLKAWIRIQAETLGISIRAAWHAYYRGKLGEPPLQRVNRKVVNVLVDVDLKYVGANTACTG